jgi:hypothetical protein
MDALSRQQLVPTHLAVRGSIRASLEIDATRGGQSGSPILSRSGQAIGMIVIGRETANGTTGQLVQEYSVGNPILTCALPGWLLEFVKGSQVPEGPGSQSRSGIHSSYRGSTPRFGSGPRGKGGPR